MANSTAGPLHIPDDVLKTTLGIIKTFSNFVSSQFPFGTVVETSEDEMFHTVSFILRNSTRWAL